MENSVSILRHLRSKWLFLALPLLAVAAYISSAYAHDKGMMGPPGRHPGMMGGPHIGRIVDAAGANETQRAQIKKIWDDLGPQLKAVHEKESAIHRQMGQELSAAKIDTAKIEKLRVQSIQLMEQASQLFTRGAIATAQVLTPEQRQKVIKDMESHHGGPHGRDGVEEHRPGCSGAGPRPPVGGATAPVPPT